MTAATRPPLERPLSTVTIRDRVSRRPVLVGAVVVVVLAVLVPLAVVLLGREPAWKPVWSEDFDGDRGAPPSARTWIVDTGTGYPGGAQQWGTGELQTYVDDPANLSLDGDGNLKITATRDSSGQWRSGRLETRRADFQPSPGGRLKVSARVKVPDGGPGYWAAFWMLGAPFRPAHTDWPATGEIDVMENIGSEPLTVHSTLHCGIYGGGPCKETFGLGGARTAGQAFSADFHTYAVEWDRSLRTEELRWYVDGKLFHTVRATDVDRDTWTRATGHGFFVLFNLAIGGGWPGPPTADTRPGASMLVDQVSVSRQD
jgi:beta-glucanase (GH16 family)